ncbi:MAG TPA: hypothetical protein VFY06_11045 [Verrucomicrobiae bacterium]|nr:hypothetical protein [Verrucomicrobiae bacterium]
MASAHPGLPAASKRNQLKSGLRKASISARVAAVTARLPLRGHAIGRKIPVTT